MFRGPSKQGSRRLALAVGSLMMGAVPRTAHADAANLGYVQARADRALSGGASEVDLNASNDTDAQNLEFQDEVGFVLGYSRRVCAWASLGARIGYGPVVRVVAGPEVRGLDVVLTPELHAHRWQWAEKRRELVISASLPLGLIAPLSARGPAVSRAVDHGVDAQVGATAGLEANLRLRLGALVLLGGVALTQRWTPFTWTTSLASDPSVSDTRHYGSRHVLVGAHFGIGATF